jgi:hypothetical protein
MVRSQAIYREPCSSKISGGSGGITRLISYWGVICEMIWSDLLVDMKRFKDGIIIGFSLGLESE